MHSTHAPGAGRLVRPGPGPGSLQQSARQLPPRQWPHPEQIKPPGVSVHFTSSGHSFRCWPEQAEGGTASPYATHAPAVRASPHTRLCCGPSGPASGGNAVWTRGSAPRAPLRQMPQQPGGTRQQGCGAVPSSHLVSLALGAPGPRASGLRGGSPLRHQQKPVPCPLPSSPVRKPVSTETTHARPHTRMHAAPRLSD